MQADTMLNKKERVGLLENFNYTIEKILESGLYDKNMGLEYYLAINPTLESVQDHDERCAILTKMFKLQCERVKKDFVSEYDISKNWRDKNFYNSIDRLMFSSLKNRNNHRIRMIVRSKFLAQSRFILSVLKVTLDLIGSDYINSVIQYSQSCEDNSKFIKTKCVLLRRASIKEVEDEK